MTTTTTIQKIVVTPVAFHDPPLLNTVGVHEPFALRSIIEVVTESTYGLGESYGDETHLARLQKAADVITSSRLSVYNTNGVYDACLASLNKNTLNTKDTDDKDGKDDSMAGMVSPFLPDKLFSPFEVACLDVQGKLAGVPVSDLLGGRIRDNVPYSAYLFYKWASHPKHPGQTDEYGPALSPEELVLQASKMIKEYGFKALKLKGGVFPPNDEIRAIRALRSAFPTLPLRLDPNGAWTVQTSKYVAKQLDGVLEYLEDPTPGLENMSAVTTTTNIPLATNMAVVSFPHLPPSIEKNAVQVVLSDHHFWGGLRKSQVLASLASTFSIRLSMHSNSHLGISLAAMTHLAAATPNLDYACDTHWPWKRQDEDVIVKEMEWVDGGVEVPKSPGLGVELDRKKLDSLHRLYLECGLQRRDDEGYMKSFQHDFSAEVPKW